MKARATIVSVVLLGASWVVAQSTSPSSTPQTGSPNSATQGSQSSVSNQSSPNSSAASQAGSNQAMTNQSPMRGCLDGSPTSGEYTLTDPQTGTVYHLTGNTADLRMHIGE